MSGPLAVTGRTQRVPHAPVRARAPERRGACVLLAACALTALLVGCGKDDETPAADDLFGDCPALWKADGEVLGSAEVEEPVRTTRRGPELRAGEWDCATGRLREDGETLVLRPVQGIPARWQVFAAADGSDPTTVYLSDRVLDIVGMPKVPDGLRDYLRGG